MSDKKPKTQTTLDKLQRGTSITTAATLDASATTDADKATAAFAAIVAGGGDEKDKKPKKDKTTKKDKKKEKKAVKGDDEDNVASSNSESDEFEPPAADEESESGRGSVSSSSEGDGSSSGSDDDDDDDDDSSEDKLRLMIAKAKLKLKRKNKNKEKSKKKSKKSAVSDKKKDKKKKNKKHTTTAASAAGEKTASTPSKNAVETEKIVPSESPAIVEHEKKNAQLKPEQPTPAPPPPPPPPPQPTPSPATWIKVPEESDQEEEDDEGNEDDDEDDDDDEVKPPPASSSSSSTTTTTATVATTAPSKKKSKKDTKPVTVDLHNGTAPLAQLIDYAISLRHSVVTPAELLTYMNKSEKHTSVILAALAVEYVVTKERPTVSKAVNTALINKIAGTLLNKLKFNPNTQKERFRTLRAFAIMLCAANSLYVPVGNSTDDPLLVKIDKPITDRELVFEGEDGVVTQEMLDERRAELVEQRKEAHRKNDEYEEAAKKFSTKEKRAHDIKRQAMMRNALLSQVSIDYVLPFLPAWTENMACFVINGEGDPFFLDKKGTNDFFNIHLFAAIIKSGSLLPVEANGVPAVCLLSFAHWLVARVRSVRNKTAQNAAEIEQRDNEMKVFQQSLFYNNVIDGAVSSTELFRKLFPAEQPPAFAAWFALHENPVWRRDAGELPDRTKPRPKQSASKRSKRKIDDDAVAAAVASPPATWPAPSVPIKAPAAAKSKSKKKQTASEGGGAGAAPPATIAEGATRDTLLADRKSGPVERAIEPRVHPLLFYVNETAAPDPNFTAKKLMTPLLKEAADKLDVLVPVRTLEQSSQKNAVTTLEAHTTSAQTVNKKKKRGAKGKRSRVRKNDDDDDDDDDDEDDEDEESSSEGHADEMFQDAKAAATATPPPSESDVDMIACLAHLEARRVRHLFFEMANPELANEVDADSVALRLKLTPAERARFDAAREALPFVPDEVVDFILKDTKYPQTLVRYLVVKKRSPKLAEHLMAADDTADFVAESDDVVAGIYEKYTKWINENAREADILVSEKDDAVARALAVITAAGVDKTRTVKKSTITLESQRAPKPARGSLTLAGSIVEGTAKLPSAASKAWLSRMMTVGSIDEKAPLSSDDLRVVADAMLHQRGRIDEGTVARVLLDESLFLNYVLYAMQKKYQRGELIASDTDLSNLPLIGRLIAAPGTGFVSYIANCCKMVHALSTLATLFRRSSFSESEVMAAHAAVVTALPKKNFTPFTVWEKTLEETQLKISDEARALVEAMCNVPADNEK